MAEQGTRGSALRYLILLCYQNIMYYGLTSSPVKLDLCTSASDLIGSKSGCYRRDPGVISP